ncbi:methyltransferase domain-containing protein [Betaproteobacteria bacterium LSUCC0117]|nr:methyltransferase domain-containing protein [Betaproteobacteria bacterium LSUCC0117]
MKYKLTERDIKIQEKLIRDYVNINPSKLFEDNLEKYTSQIQNFLIQGLGIPPLFYEGKSLLDLGCGTGETTRVLSKLGCDVTGIDFNAEAIKLAEELFERDNLKARLAVGSIYALDDIPDIQAKYDIVSSFGVIHHLPNQRAALKALAEKVKDGGLLILAVGTGVAGLQFLLIKWACRAFPKIDISTAAKLLFPEWIRRCSVFGHRSEESVINDNIINSQHDYIPLSQLIELLQQNEMNLLATFPEIEKPSGDSLMNNTLDRNLDTFKTSLMFNEVLWSMHTHDDVERSPQGQDVSSLYEIFLGIHDKINGNVDEYKAGTITNIPDMSAMPNIDNDKFYDSKIRIYLTELKNFLEIIDHGVDIHRVAKAVQDYEILFKGTAGLNMNYLSFYKEKK